MRSVLLQGFRKVDPDRWEFANEGFLRGQKHLLKSINRRKPAHGQSNSSQASQAAQGSVGSACVEVGKFGLEEEVEILKRDKNVLMQELVRLRQQQQSTDGQLQTMVQRLQGMEQRQQQMMSFLAKAVQSPGFLAQFVQQQNETNRVRISAEANKKRRLRQESGAGDGQIIKYQPMANDPTKALLRQILKMDSASSSSSPEMIDSFDGGGGPGNLMIGDGSMDRRPSGVTLQEVFPTAQPAASEIVGGAAQPGPGEISGADESGFVLPSLSDDGFDLDVDALGLGPMLVDLDTIGQDPEIDNLLDTSTFWDDFLLSPVAEEPSQDGDSNGITINNNEEEDSKENGWTKTRNMDKLTEKMELLSSDVDKV